MKKINGLLRKGRGTSKEESVAFIEVASSILDGRSLLWALRHDYAELRRSDMTCRFFSFGTHDTFRLNSHDRTFFFRLYSLLRSDTGRISAEAKLITALYEAGIHAARPLVADNGESYVEVITPEGVRAGVLFEAVGGEEVENFTQSQLRSLGAYLATIHSTLVATRLENLPELSPDMIFDSFFRRALPRFYRSGYQTSQLAEIVRKIRTASAIFPWKELDYGPCHGDFHHRNLRLVGAGWACFDFAEAGRGPQVFDIATLLWGFLRISGQSWNTSFEQLSFLLKGYCLRRPVSPRELSSLPLCVALKEIQAISVLSENLGRWGDDVASDADIERRCRFFAELAEMITHADSCVGASVAA